MADLSNYFLESRKQTTSSFSYSKILKHFNYKNSNAAKDSVIATTESALKTLIVQFDNDTTYEMHQDFVFRTGMEFRLWLSCTIDYSSHMSQLASFSYFKNLPPNSFDTWYFIDYLYWAKSMSDIAEQQNTKDKDETENSKVGMSDAMRSAKSAKAPAMPKMRIPKIR